MKRQGKISVRFFLNKNVMPLTPPLLSGTKLYPLYVQVTYNRKNTQFRSEGGNYYSSLEDAYNRDRRKIENEESLIKKIIEFETSISKHEYQLAGLVDRYWYITRPIETYIEEFFKTEILYILRKTSSKFIGILDPTNQDNISFMIYYEACLKIVENFESEQRKDFSQEVNWGNEFLTWCKSKKNTPRLLDWVDKTLVDAYKFYLKKEKTSDNTIEMKIAFIDNAIKSVTGINEK